MGIPAGAINHLRVFKTAVHLASSPRTTCGEVAYHYTPNQISQQHSVYYFLSQMEDAGSTPAVLMSDHSHTRQVYTYEVNTTAVAVLVHVHRRNQL